MQTDERRNCENQTKFEEVFSVLNKQTPILINKKQHLKANIDKSP